MYNEFVSEDIRNDSNIIVPVICDDMFEYKESEEALPLSIKEIIYKTNKKYPMFNYKEK